MKSFLTTAALTVILIVGGSHAHGQKSRLDSLLMTSDSTALMDSLMKDFDDFLDSLITPKSFFTIGIGAGTGIFSFENTNSAFLTTEKKLIISPSAGYFHKSGLGLSASAYMIDETKGLNFYQFVISPSFDVIKRKFSTGISFSRYISKDSLQFYTTPIQNEVFGYFSYKKWWLRPTISVSYGWGSKTEYEKRKSKLQRRLSQRSPQYVIIENKESVSDLSLTFSIKKDFNWYDVLSRRDNVTFTPVVLLNTGTQNYGFNTSYTYTLPNAIRVNSAPSNSNVTEKTSFAAQSISMVFRGTYMKGKFMLQPQVFFDYYLPDAEEKFNTVFSLTASVSF